MGNTAYDDLMRTGRGMVLTMASVRSYTKVCGGGWRERAPAAAMPPIASRRRIKREGRAPAAETSVASVGYEVG